MIPRVIHYCWFGKNPKSELINKCIESWKRFCSDFEIKEWNEDNFDLLNSCAYVKEAYEARKWAFVSDYVRHHVLNEFGGVYLDTDVELIKPIDGFLTNNFLALEAVGSINTGLIMGCEKNMPYCRWMLDSYQKDKFLLPNGEYNTITVCERTTKYFMERGFEKKNIIQNIDGFHIYSTEYFCPKDPITFETNFTENTVSIHHYGASWCSSEQKEYFEKRARYVKKVSYNLASVIAYYQVKKKRYGFLNAMKMTLTKIFQKWREKGR